MALSFGVLDFLGHSKICQAGPKNALAVFLIGLASGTEVAVQKPANSADFFSKFAPASASGHNTKTLRESAPHLKFVIETQKD